MTPVREVAPDRLLRDANLYQSAFWARFKERRRLRTQAFEIEHERGTFPLVLVHRPITVGAGVGYAPHGPAVPVDAEDQGPFLEDVSESLRELVPPSCRFLRFDLPWASPYTEGGGWAEPPEPRVREMRMNFGCRRWRLRKAPTDVQPPDTVVLDLAHEPERILDGMHPKHRRCIRQAGRRGVTVGRGTLDDLAAWHRLHLETSQRQGVAAEELSYFRDLLTTARHHDADVLLYLAHRAGGLVAGAIVVLLAGRAYYLFSASSLAGRRCFASFAVLWRAVLEARESGCRALDLMGIPPDDRPGHPMHGLYRFKTRFGGSIRHRRGCWDYPFDEGMYPALALVGDTRNALHRR